MVGPKLLHAKGALGAQPNQPKHKPQSLAHLTAQPTQAPSQTSNYKALPKHSQNAPLVSRLTAQFHHALDTHHVRPALAPAHRGLSVTKPHTIPYRRHNEVCRKQKFLMSGLRNEARAARSLL